jgi:hypothetical protein
MSTITVSHASTHSPTILHIICAHSGWNVLVDPRAYEGKPQTSVELTDTPIREAVQKLFPDARLAHRGTLLLVTAEEVPGWGAEGVPNTHEIDPALPKNTLQLMPGTPAGAWFEMLAAQGGLTVTISPELGDLPLAYAVDLKGVSFEDALTGSALLNGFGVEVADGAFTLTKGSALFPDGPPAYEPKTASGRSKASADTDPAGRIETLFAEIHQLASDGNDEEAVGRIVEVRDVMTDGGSKAISLCKQALKRWGPKLKEANGELVLSINLQLYVAVGAGHLRNMARAIKRSKFDAARKSHAKLEKIATSMERFKHEAFHNNADAMRVRGESLLARAQQVEAISTTFGDVRVSALALGSGGARAVVNGKVVSKGDDVAGLSPALTLSDVVRSSVKLTWAEGEILLGLE